VLVRHQLAVPQALAIANTASESRGARVHGLFNCSELLRVAPSCSEMLRVAQSC